MPPHAPPGYNLPPWLLPLLGALLSLVVALTGWAFNLASKVTQIDTRTAEHEIWSERRAQTINARLDESNRTNIGQAEDTRKVVADLREDVAGIRAVLKIEKTK